MKAMLILLLLLSGQALGEIIPLEWQNANHKTISISHHEYPVVRIKREGAIPVLLLHGLGGNAHNWMEIGSNLYKAGYDVWAITWSARFDRNIEQTGKRTVREIVEYVYEKTGKKMFIAGHSLGGIIGKIYTLGIDRHFFSQKLFINKRLQDHSRKYISGLVSVSSPSGMDKRLQKFIPILQRIPSRTSLGHADLSLVINENRLERDLYFVKAFELSTVGSRLPIINRFVRAMFNTQYQNVSDYNIGKLIRYGTSPISKKITNQIGTDEQNERDNRIMTEFFHTEKNHVPFAYIAGEVDDIASSDIIRAEAEAQNSEFLLLPQAGHMDPLSGQLVTDTSLFMIKFFNNQ